MKKGRLEAFSDGVIAIVITVMVFDIKAPSDTSWTGLAEVLPSIATYVMSFLYLGIYWNNHHHMLQVTDRINGTILWTNLHLLFWLSLLPFGTNWMRASEFSPLPTATYGTILLFAAVAYKLLQTSIIRFQGADSRLANAVGTDWKGKLSLVVYGAAMVVAVYEPLAAVAIYAIVAVLWTIPDRRIEKLFE
ncbi:hypothetical protein SV7mr_30830 [Stieleria bergensis]|uniref:DUF1211 domain-containing protein n=1 Tax=Stieleria bergensis TaxID=2528025 RepID=A0A517SWP4_9BACT|nr:hypothetical protein SV7mr_30830 [Planctomycetes bacterium SV_7m_r]